MSATAFSALSTMMIFAQTPVDSDAGIIYGMENQGLLTKSIGYKATRDNTSYKNHRGQEVIHIKTNPKLELSVEADITLLTGALAALHPGTPIHKDYIQDCYTDIAHGFSLTTGYFIYDAPDTSSPQAGLNSSKFTLTWFAPPANTAQLVAAPSAP